MKRINTGQMFIELVVGIAIIMVTLVGVISLSTQAAKNGRMSGNRDKAVIYAERKLESVRQDRNNDPNDFFVNRRAGGNCDGDVSADFTCVINYEYSPALPEEANSAIIQVTVGWNDGGADFSATKTTILTNSI